MSRPFKRSRLAIGVALVAALAASTLAIGSIGTAGATGSVRGFDGSTITLASIGVTAQFTPGVPNGVQARIKAFNDNNEIKGVQLKWTEFADDKQNDTDALNESRRLVTQTGVFALVGDTSANNPGAYLNQQHVPYFGWAFDNTYCSTKPSSTLYGFGYNGCLVPAAPSVMGDNGFQSVKYVAQKTGHKNPTLAIFSNDTEAGKNSVKFQQIAYKGAGYKIVATNNQMPIPPVADYTPYAQAMLTADGGKAPDAILCLLATDCISMYTLIQANGYTGTYISSLYSNFLTKALGGSAANVPVVPLDATTNNAGLLQMEKDLDAYQAGASQKVDTATIAGYASTDMFIQALKTVAKKGKSNITPENVQKAAAKQTWQIKGLAGPTTYPQSTVSPFPTCTALTVSDGTTWKTVEPFACSKKQYKVK
jgi:ABC-type branched-subunit amino acid transport system substrate-binding protein